MKGSEMSKVSSELRQVSEKCTQSEYLASCLCFSVPISAKSWSLWKAKHMISSDTYSSMIMTTYEDKNASFSC